MDLQELKVKKASEVAKQLMLDNENLYFRSGTNFTLVYSRKLGVDKQLASVLDGTNISSGFIIYAFKPTQYAEDIVEGKKKLVPTSHTRQILVPFFGENGAEEVHYIPQGQLTIDLVKEIPSNMSEDLLEQMVAEYNLGPRSLTK